MLWKIDINISEVTLLCDTNSQVPQQHGSEQQAGHGVKAVLMLQTTPPPLTYHQLPLSMMLGPFMVFLTRQGYCDMLHGWRYTLIFYRSTFLCNSHVTGSITKHRRMTLPVLKPVLYLKRNDAFTDWADTMKTPPSVFLHSVSSFIWWRWFTGLGEWVFVCPRLGIESSGGGQTL